MSSPGGGGVGQPPPASGQCISQAVGLSLFQRQHCRRAPADRPPQERDVLVHGADLREGGGRAFPGTDRVASTVRPGRGMLTAQERGGTRSADHRRGVPQEPVCPSAVELAHIWGCFLTGRLCGRDFRCFYSHSRSGRKAPLSPFYTEGD